jgi:hypothetical protein
MATLNIVSVGTIFLNTIVRIIPVALYTGSAMSGLIFGDFRGTILFAGFMINEMIAYGYRLILNGVYNPQCALMKTEEDFFVLPSPITQTFGFFYGFLMAEMYNQGAFLPTKFFVMTAIMILVIYSRVNIGCKSTLDAVYTSLLGMILGMGYFQIVKDYYRQDFFKIDKNTEDLVSDFFKLDA